MNARKLTHRAGGIAVVAVSPVKTATSAVSQVTLLAIVPVPLVAVTAPAVTPTVLAAKLGTVDQHFPIF